ncbi:MAG TPA: hypothetical protein PLH61_04910 [Bacteroidia bacterium]|jgi:hypothetical protein|nr:hypothetical protein [Bacteroidia bacterium]
MKVKIVLILVVLCLACFISHGQGINKSPQLVSYYVQIFQDTTRIEVVKVKSLKKNQHRIIFKGGFENDTLKIYVNNKFKNEFILTSQESTDNTNQYCDVKLKGKNIVKVEINNTECLYFSFLDSYKLVNISRMNSEWYITYSNYYWFSE